MENNDSSKEYDKWFQNALYVFGIFCAFEIFIGGVFLLVIFTNPDLRSAGFESPLLKEKSAVYGVFEYFFTHKISITSFFILLNMFGLISVSGVFQNMYTCHWILLFVSGTYFVILLVLSVIFSSPAHWFMKYANSEHVVVVILKFIPKTIVSLIYLFPLGYIFYKTFGHIKDSA